MKADWTKKDCLCQNETTAIPNCVSFIGPPIYVDKMPRDCYSCPLFPDGYSICKHADSPLEGNRYSDCILKEWKKMSKQIIELIVRQEELNDVIRLLIYTNNYDYVIVRPHDYCYKVEAHIGEPEE